jgi:2-deoxy-D-gluconate 3-dehydrogenase
LNIMSFITTLFDLSGRTAIVTGASRGIGASATEALEGAGANIVLVGREQETLREQEARLARHGVQTLSVVCDMGIPEQIVGAAATARKRFGQVDILINNAGIIRRHPAEEYPLEEWNEVLNVNLTGLFLMAQEVGREMIARRSGKIVNIASLLSFSGGLNVAAYTASKSAVAGLTRALANEWGRRNVNVNGIAPGYFKTEATEALQRDPERFNALLARIPAGRWGEPDDLIGTFLYLTSRASDYVHGHLLTVDGGWMAA